MGIQTASQAIANEGSTFGFRNRIINGDMRIDQRNAGTAITPSAENQMSVDRFRTAQAVASKLTYQRVEDAPAGFKYSLKVTTATAYSPAGNEYFVLQQHIEKNNALDLDFGLGTASSFTVSFWVKGSVAGNYGVRFGNFESSARCYTASFPVTSTWTKIVIVVPGDTGGTSSWGGISDTGLYLGVQFSLGQGSANLGTAGSWQTPAAWYNNQAPTGSTNLVATQGATLNITGLQLEKGNQSTNFDYRSYTTELQLCQRYFRRINSGKSSTGAIIGVGYQASTTTAVIGITYTVPMRSAPTASYSSLIVSDSVTYDSPVSSMSLDATADCVYLSAVHTAFGATYRPVSLRATASSSGYLDFSAEF